MFEAGQEDTQPKSTKMWIGLFVVVALIAIGALYYFISKGSVNHEASPAAQATVAPAGPADAIHDLKIVRTSMEKGALVLRSLAESHPDTQAQLFAAGGELNRYVNVYLNDEDVRVLDGLDTPVGGADVLVILPAMAGG